MRLDATLRTATGTSATAPPAKADICDAHFATPN
jgi:hypothetical protein